MQGVDHAFARWRNPADPTLALSDEHVHFRTREPDGFEKLQIVPLLIITPLTFLGGSFYSVNMLPGVWKQVALFNPVVYLISGFRWSFFGTQDVAVSVSLAATAGFLALCLFIVWLIFKTGWRLKS